MMNNKMKKRILIIAVCIVILLLMCNWVIPMLHIKTQRPVFLENQMNITDELSQSEKENIEKALNNYLIVDDEYEYYSDLPIDYSNNVYAVYYLFYDYLLLTELNGNTEAIEKNIGYINTAIEDSVRESGVGSLDIVALLCLQQLIHNKYNDELMNYYLENHYSRGKNLYFDNSEDELADMIGYSADVCRMFNLAGIKYDKSLLKGIDDYYLNRHFDTDKNIGIFYCGGDAIYAEYILNGNIHIEDGNQINEWYSEWEKEYSKGYIDSWEDLMIIDCEFRPIVEALGKEYDFSSENIFLQNDDKISEFVNDAYEERLAYDLFIHHVEILSAESKTQFVNKINECILEHISDIERMSIEQTFYGLELLYAVDGEEYKNNKIWNTVIHYFSSMVQYYETQEVTNIDSFIDEAYFFTILEYQAGEGELSEDIKNLLHRAYSIISNNITKISNPKTLSRACFIFSYTKGYVSRSLSCKIEEQYTSYVKNYNVIESIYVIDLWEIQEVMGYSLISERQIFSIIKKLWNEESSAYKECLTYAGNELHNNYYVNAFDSSNVNFEASNTLDVDVNSAFNLKLVYYLYCVYD